LDWAVEENQVMPFVPCKLQNSSDFPGSKPPSIIIKKDDVGWAEAYEKWKKGENPTADPDWKQGVYLCFTKE
jgi:hypothetical protein